MPGVELLGHRFGSQLFPVLFKWFILSVSQITACKIVALFVSCVKAETGTTHPAGLYILSNKAGLNLIWSLQAWLDISTVKGSRELCIDSLIKTFQMFVARSLLTGTRSVIPDSKVLPYIIFCYGICILLPVWCQSSLKNFLSTNLFSKHSTAPCACCPLCDMLLNSGNHLRERSIKEISPSGELFRLVWIFSLEFCILFG